MFDESFAGVAVPFFLVGPCSDEGEGLIAVWTLRFRFVFLERG